MTGESCGSDAASPKVSQGCLAQQKTVYTTEEARKV